jgi:hypothetical protein
MREKLSEIYLTNIGQFGFPFRIINGTGQERLHNAIQFINEIL